MRPCKNAFSTQRTPMTYPRVGEAFVPAGKGKGRPSPGVI